MIVAYGGNNTQGSIDVAAALLAKGQGYRGDFESETFVAHTLRAEGFDASEDGTGRGIPIISVEPYTLAIRGRAGEPDLEHRQDGLANAVLTPGGGRGGVGVGAIAFDSRQDAISSTEVFGALGSSHPQAQAVAFDLAQITSATNRSSVEPGPAPTMSSGSQMHAAGSFGVRRLTPRECERLQGFPDDFTLLPFRNKPVADGHRYKALGNSMAVPVIRWIGRRIEAQHLEAQGSNQ